MKTFECPSCNNPVPFEHLDYDEFGAGCPHCGFEFSHATLREIAEGDRHDANQPT